MAVIFFSSSSFGRGVPDILRVVINFLDMKNRGVVKFITVRGGHTFVVNDHGEHVMSGYFSLI